jgi:hypothetical protein
MQSSQQPIPPRTQTTKGREMRLCQWSECDQEAKTRNLCNKHYLYALRKGIVNQFPYMRRKDQFCSEISCSRPHKVNGFCAAHNYRFNRGLDMSKPIKGSLNNCIVENCERKPHSNGYCTFHRKRIQTGIPLDAPLLRQKYDEEQKCKIDVCKQKAKLNGMCRFHYGRQKKNPNFKNLSRFPRGLILPEIIPLEDLWRLNVCKDKTHGYEYVKYNKKRRPFHQVVWEAHNGRRVRPFENVHHLNGIRDDNRIENLELWTKPQPCGQRPEDLVAWVHEHYRELLEARLALF